MKTILELKEISKTYRSSTGDIFYALKGINLKIYTGDFISIMGPSGSGKTTLANLIGLLSKPSNGTLNFLSHSCQDMTQDQMTLLRRHHIGFIFQDYMLIEHMTALQNVMLSMHLEKQSAKKTKTAAFNLLDRLGLKDHTHKLPRQLSGGQKQRVAIARALIKEPALILADEPAGALDPVSRSDILSILQELNSAGSTIVMVTHNTEDALAGTRLLRINSSQIESDEPINDRNLFKMSS